jgi:hypothetical protein
LVRAANRKPPDSEVERARVQKGGTPEDLRPCIQLKRPRAALRELLIDDAILDNHRMDDPHRNDHIAARVETKDTTIQRPSRQPESGDCIGTGTQAIDNTISLLRESENKDQIGFTH